MRKAFAENFIPKAGLPAIRIEPTRAGQTRMAMTPDVISCGGNETFTNARPDERNAVSNFVLNWSNDRSETGWPIAPAAIWVIVAASASENPSVTTAGLSCCCSLKADSEVVPIANPRRDGTRIWSFPASTSSDPSRVGRSVERLSVRGTGRLASSAPMPKTEAGRIAQSVARAEGDFIG